MAAGERLYAGPMAGSFGSFEKPRSMTMFALSRPCSSPAAALTNRFAASAEA